MKLPEKIYLTVPTSWAELDDHQLYYIFGLFADNLSSAQIKAYCFFTWSGTKLLCRYGDGYLAKRGKEEFTLTSAVVASAIHALDWVDVLPDIPVRISKIKGAKAAEPTLVGFAFERYLYCENIYQGYLQTQQHHLLNEMAHLLYDSDKITPNQAEKIGIFYWWMGLKSYYARQFPHFFQSVSDNANLLHANSNRPPSSAELQQAMNAQIRALTKGDVTKESQILTMTKIEKTKKYEFSFVSEELPNVRAKFLIRGKWYLCSELQCEITSDGMSKVMKGTFWRILFENIVEEQEEGEQEEETSENQE